MSTTTTHLPPPPPLPTTAHYYITNLGLGYAIAIAFGFLVLFSSLLLISYICIRHRHTQHNHIRTHNTHGVSNNNNNNNVVLSNIIFIDEDPNEDQDVVVGLDQSVINSYPKFEYSKGVKKGFDTLCAICLCEYREVEMLRMMPDCKHCFHLTCVDAWLKLNASCPVCRNSPLPTPLSTPLAEVVPLSQYSDGRHRRFWYGICVKVLLECENVTDLDLGQSR
ncbi:putative transcription factor C2H2 family [Helianthus annuus]|nr:putative transcription factor C2H2 family [Helianthus annuus]